MIYNNELYKQNSIEKKFIFSVVMAVYNTENYLREALDSVVNQTIGFLDNVQLILVDDGSSDCSLDIICEYNQMYPDNVVVVSQENCGPACARNNGLKYVKGTYVNFLDSDDYLSLNAMEEVYDFFQAHESEIDVVTIPMFYFEKNNKEHPLNFKYKCHNIIDLNKDFNYPQLSISSTFIKKEIFESFNFNEKLLFNEDSLLINKILLEKKRYGFVNSSKYYFRKRFQLNALSDTNLINKKYYADRLKNFHLNLIDYCLSKENNVPQYIQHVLIYDLQHVIRQSELDIYNESEKNEFKKILSSILEYIEDNVILENDLIKDKVFRKFLLYLKYNKSRLDYSGENVVMRISNHQIDSLKSHKIWINNIDVCNDFLTISGTFTSYFDTKYISVCAVKKDKSKIIKEYKGNELKKIKRGKRFLSHQFQYVYNFIVDVPISNDKLDIILRVNFHKDGTKDNFHKDNLVSKYLKINFKKTSKLFYNNHFIKNQYLVSYNKKHLKVNLCSKKLPFKFSIVMAIYNTEEYLEESINSIITQDIGFERNVQLILVDDGSTDDSWKIISNYKKMFPKNVVALSQENGGQASARNNGLKYVKGRYVNFLDSDDYLSKNALSEVYKFFEEHMNETDVVALPLKSFGRFNNDHKLNYKFKISRVINLKKEPNNPQLSSSSTFISEEVVTGLKFPTTFVGSEDANLINKVLLNKKTLGVINTANYYYRRRENESSTLDTMPKNVGYYNPRLKGHFIELINYCKSLERKVPSFIQYALIYDLHWLLMGSELEIYDSQEDIQEFWENIEIILSNINNNVIFYNKNISSLPLKKFILCLKNKNEKITITDDNVLMHVNQFRIDNMAIHKIWLDFIDLKNNVLSISGTFTSVFDLKYISIRLVRYNSSNIEMFVSDSINYSKRLGTTYMSRLWNKTYNFEFNIDMDSNDAYYKIQAIYHINGNNNDYSENNIKIFDLDISFKSHAKISHMSNYFIKDHYLIKFNSNDNSISCQRASVVKNITSELSVLSRIITSFKQGMFYAFFFRLMYGLIMPIMDVYYKNQPVYLFMDRRNTPDDNATHLFKHASKIDDNIHKYMVVNKKSEYYNKIKEYGNVLDCYSLKYKFLYLYSQKIISTHPYDTILSPFFERGEFDYREFYDGLITSKVYFLQHGVTKDNVSGWLSRFSKNFYLFLTVSDMERNSILTEDYNYDENVIQALGFPRFDNLKNDSNQKRILIIPTWRDYLKDDKYQFLSSDYFNSLNNLINNPKLIKMAKEYGYEIVFKGHPELYKNIADTDEKYIDLFSVPNEVHLSVNKPYQELFNEARVLITDYSSVFFDFAYLYKPVIYYQPNDDYHYEDSYYDYETMGFGKVIKKENDLINQIEYYIKNDCIMEDKYKQCVNNFFKYTDQNNCKRVYDWIKKN